MTLSKISVADYFDQNSHSHDSRTQPDAVAVRQAGHTKLGFGLNAKQEISKEVGLFARLGYNDGRNEIRVFTEIDQSASLGVVCSSWKKVNLSEIVSSTLVLISVVCFVVALHTFYLRKWSNIVFKSVMLSFAYSVVLVVAGLVSGFSGLFYF